MRTKFWFTQLLLISCLLKVSSVSAIMIDFVPASSSVEQGASLNVDIVISDLASAGEIVSAYDLNVSYDSSYLSATDVTFGNYLDDLFFPGFTLQDSSLTTPGLINLSELSLLSDAELAAQQPDSFTLATLTFEALAIGTSALIFEPDPFFGIDVKGNFFEVLALDAGTGSVTVTGPVGVPEPSSLLLFALAFLFPGFFRRTNK